MFIVVTSRVKRFAFLITWLFVSAIYKWSLAILNPLGSENSASSPTPSLNPDLPFPNIVRVILLSREIHLIL